MKLSQYSLVDYFALDFIGSIAILLLNMKTGHPPSQPCFIWRFRNTYSAMILLVLLWTIFCKISDAAPTVEIKKALIETGVLPTDTQLLKILSEDLNDPAFHDLIFLENKSETEKKASYQRLKQLIRIFTKQEAKRFLENPKISETILISISNVLKDYESPSQEDEQFIRKIKMKTFG